MFKSRNVPKRGKDCLNFRRFEIFTIDLRVILSIIIATGVYALLFKFLQKNSPHNVQTNRGGVKGFLNNVQKNCTFLS